MSWCLSRRDFKGSGKRQHKTTSVLEAVMRPKSDNIQSAVGEEVSLETHGCLDPDKNTKTISVWTNFTR